MNTLLSGGKIFEPMRHASNAVLAVVLAFFINFIIVLINSTVKRASNTEIINTCDISFNASNIVGRKTGVFSTKFFFRWIIWRRRRRRFLWRWRRTWLLKKRFIISFSFVIIFTRCLYVL